MRYGWHEFDTVSRGRAHLTMKHTTLVLSHDILFLSILGVCVEDWKSEA